MNAADLSEELKTRYFDDILRFEDYCKDTFSKNKDSKLYAVVGNPIKHSMSPLLHLLLGDEIKYFAVKVETQELEKFCEIAKKYLQGFNITVPHKINIIQYLDSADEFSLNLQSVNTVKVSGGKLFGYNTDVYGLKLAIENLTDTKSLKTALILGSGGAAKAAVSAAKELNCNVTVAARNTAKAKEIFPDVKVCDISGNLADSDLVINCTPCGMLGQEDEIAADITKIKGVQLFYDTVYNPLTTSHIKLCQSAGIKYSNGLSMLILQGAKAREIWQGVMPKLDLDTLLARLSAEIFKTKLTKPLVFTGFMASGKSTVSSYLARISGFNIIDTDAEIEKTTGKKIKQIFQESGEPYFRALELETIKNIDLSKFKIVSLGGGAILQRETREFLKQNAIIVYVDTPLQECITRASRTNERPLLLKPYEEIKALYDMRNEIYLSSADITAQGTLPLDNIVLEIMQKIK